MNIAKISLGGDWKMRQCADGAEYDAKVPGTVLSVLLELWVCLSVPVGL